MGSISCQKDTPLLQCDSNQVDSRFAQKAITLDTARVLGNCCTYHSHTLHIQVYLGAPMVALEKQTEALLSHSFQV